MRKNSASFACAKVSGCGDFIVFTEAYGELAGSADRDIVNRRALDVHSVRRHLQRKIQVPINGIQPPFESVLGGFDYHALSYKIVIKILLVFHGLSSHPLLYTMCVRRCVRGCGEPPLPSRGVWGRQMVRQKQQPGECGRAHLSVGGPAAERAGHSDHLTIIPSTYFRP